MPLLDAEPPPSPRSLEELFALAHAMESRAAEAYAGFSRMMASEGRADLAAVFEAVAAEERGHVEGVDAWSLARLGQLPGTGVPPVPSLPTFEEESEAEIAGSALMTPYRALSIAVRNEERAFAFWAYLAAHAERDDVREAAEKMASEELAHAAIFRRERRRAFHRERDAGAVRITALEGELKLRAMLRDAGGPAPAGGGVPGIDDLVENVRRTEGADALQVRVSPATTPEQLAEELADAYVAAVVSVSATAGEWQVLAERALRRAATLARRRHGTSL
jgi:rubrerythrin